MALIPCTQARWQQGVKLEGIQKSVRMMELSESMNEMKHDSTTVVSV